jgi:hypothetical protein
VQEFSLKQLFLSENIPFVFQKEFSFPKRSYFVDFFLQDYLLLECSFTQSSQYDGVFRQKAVLLDAKAAYIKRFFSYPMFILFESPHFIGKILFTTLCRLMPSVDQFFTSRSELLENLPKVFENNRKKQVITNSSCLSSGNSKLKKTFQNQHDSVKTSSTLVGSKISLTSSLSSSDLQFINLHEYPSPELLNQSQVIFSLMVNKQSTEDRLNFGVSNYPMEDGSL